MRVDRIKGKRFLRRETHHLRTGIAEKGTKNLVLLLRNCKIRNALKCQLLPRRPLRRSIPPGAFRRTHHHPQQLARQGMAVE